MSAIIGSVRAHTKQPPSGSSVRGVGRGNVNLFFWQLLIGPPRFHIFSQFIGIIERWHQTLKNRILLENYFLPGDLEAQIEAFVDNYNHQRYHESINNVTPTDVYFGCDKAILREREKIKKRTIQQRRLQHQKQAA